MPRDAAVALAGVREAGFVPGRRADYQRAIVYERDAALAAVGAVVSGAAVRASGTALAISDGDWSSAAKDSALEDEAFWSAAAIGEAISWGEE